MPSGIYIRTQEHNENISKALSGKNSYRWAGDSVGYGGLHIWIRKKLGKPSKCENCGTKKAKKYEWANISGNYKRDLTDWARLCNSCHKLFDDTGRKIWTTRKSREATK